VTGELGKNPYLFGKESTFVTGGGLPGRTKPVEDGSQNSNEVDSENEIEEELED